MPSTPYDLVKDDQDLRIPLYAEQAFFRGITFQAKFIGWQEVARPNSRTEIVNAMRRIRYECKAQNVKKRKVTIQISVNGVRVSLKKKKRKKKQWTNEADDIELCNHPIYRIFYVSHDSSDLKIFSYIARDSKTDSFKCSVFKSNKKSQAMRIVRTVGQAFEVCHKVNLQKNSLENNDDRSDQSFDLLDNESQKNEDDDEQSKDPTSITPDPSPIQRPNHLELVPQTNCNYIKSSCSDGEKSPITPLSTSKEIQELRQQLEQQSLQTRQALGQLMLVREQLISESKARIEAQARTQQLLQQNRELIEHLASLGGYTEPDRTGLTPANIGLAPQSQLQMMLQEQNDLASPMRKAYLSNANNNNLASLSQQLNNLGSINQQLNSLSHQLSGLNQHSQNLQNFQNLGNLSLPTTTNTFPTIGQIQNISNKLSNLPQANHDIITQQDLFQMNQDLLNQLQNLNLGRGMQGTMNNMNGNTLTATASSTGSNNNGSPQNSFVFTNPGHLSSSPCNNNNNFNFLNSPSSLGNLTPSPIGTLNRTSYSNSPMDDNLGLSIDKNLNECEDSLFIKPLSQVGTLTTLDLDGKVKVIVPMSATDGRSGSASSSPIKKNDSRQTQQQQQSAIPGMVMLKVTDEAGNVTNTRKLSATPSFITRSTSEKVPNRSQMMSQVQRTTWARHTTK